MPTDEILKRIEILETQQAFQEDTIESLNQVIVQQQKDIERLNLKVDVLQERIKQSAAPHSEMTGEEPPPPHY
ncbi:MAG: lysis protein [Gammaproteobacteria bacterium]|nr:MAG: lysis protein [Gammaproteobacteria bacterium]